MNLSSKLGPVMLDLKSKALEVGEIEKIRHPSVGGIILFSRNYEGIDQLAELISAVRRARSGLLIAVDQEGGRVQRFREGFCRLPAAGRYRQAHGRSREQAGRLAELAGWLMAAELRALDVDFSFAPVLDVDCGSSEVIGDRSFSTDAEEAACLAAAFRRGMNQAGMSAVGKHFPGHGGVAHDSHLTLPVDARPLHDLQRKDCLPFQRLIAEGLEGIMPAHVIYSAVDDKPAGFSKRWIQDILRSELGFSGAVFSDDLSMAGAAFAGDYPDRARLAMEAGCDMVLVCNQPEAAAQVLDAVAPLLSSTHPERLERMKGGFPIDRESLRSSDQWLAASAAIQQLTNA